MFSIRSNTEDVLVLPAISTEFDINYLRTNDFVHDIGRGSSINCTNIFVYFSNVRNTVFSLRTQHAPALISKMHPLRMINMEKRLIGLNLKKNISQNEKTVSMEIENHKSTQSIFIILFLGSHNLIYLFICYLIDFYGFSSEIFYRHFNKRKIK